MNNIFETTLGRAYNFDCFDVMASMPDGCVDMLFADLPYGTTACKWDTVIPFEKLWSEFKRICKPSAAMVFTASQPFTSTLVTSNLKGFRYEWIWKKTRGTTPMQCKRRPNALHESVLLFQDGLLQYNPQMTEGKAYRISHLAGGLQAGNKTQSKEPFKGKISNGGRWPVTVLEFSNPPSTFHPTQKPVALLEYLIKTYTHPGELVFDPTAGSLTTGVAAENLGRRWVCCEQLEEYFTKGVARFKL